MRILYATDGSSAAKEGERLIASMFDPSDLHIETFSVHRDLMYTMPPVDYSGELERLEAGPTNAEDVAREAAAHLSEHGFDVSSSSEHGDPATRILRKLEADKHDLVVLGASHTTWMGTLLLGSVSMHVLHHADCSVLVAHRAPTGSAKVLMAADGSGASIAALETAMRLLDRAKCSFRVASAVIEPWVSVAVYPPGLPLGSHAAFEAENKKRVDHAWDVIEQTRLKLKEAGFESDGGAVLLGTAGSHLLKETGEFGADLVIAGSRGLGPVRRAYLGSVSDQLVRHSPAALIGRTSR